MENNLINPRAFCKARFSVLTQTGLRGRVAAEGGAGPKHGQCRGQAWPVGDLGSALGLFEAVTGRKADTGKEPRRGKI